MDRVAILFALRHDGTGTPGTSEPKMTPRSGALNQ